jgi:zeta-carotene desaturase
LPAPLHGLPKLLAASAFTFADKLSLARAFSAILRVDPKSQGAETLSDWLVRHRQTSGAVERFWRLVIASALNADLDTIAVPYAAKVVRELFMNSPEAGSMGMSTVPLSQIYSGAEEYLKSKGAQIHLNTNVESAEWDEEVSEWTITTRSGKIVSGYLILALPFEATAKLIPHLPPSEDAESLAAQIQRHEHWPLSSVHLWFDREITDLPHAVLLDREIHWMYNKGRLQPWRNVKGSYLELVQSASREFAAKPREQAIDQALQELVEFFPAVREAKLEKVALVKEVHATFGVPPGIDAFRPGQSDSPWPNLFLAGDWTATGWPSTMESAARSGHLAAEALCAAIGTPRKLLAPDLKPRGLMRFLSR